MLFLEHKYHSSPDVQLFDYIRAEIGERMVDRMFDLTRPLNTIAEIGCNRGFITCHELPEGVEQIYLCDSSATMLKQAQARSKAGAHKVSLVQLDEETPKVNMPVYSCHQKYKYI